jgi:hypothetical protein
VFEPQNNNSPARSYDYETQNKIRFHFFVTTMRPIFAFSTWFSKEKRRSGDRGDKGIRQTAGRREAAGFQKYLFFESNATKDEHLVIFEFCFHKISISENRFQRLPFADELISLSPLSPHLLLFFAALPLCVFVSTTRYQIAPFCGFKYLTCKLFTCNGYI